MLVVVAEIWPGGDECRSVVIGEITAANISDLRELGDYAVHISQLGDDRIGAVKSEHEFLLRGHWRSAGVWELVRQITNRRRLAEHDSSVALAVVAERAASVLNCPQAAVRWLAKPLSSLNGKRPVELLGANEGVDQLLALLDQVEENVAPEAASESVSDGVRAMDEFELVVDRVLGTRIRANDAAANEMWSALANIQWVGPEGELASYSFRSAGTMIAHVRREGSYIDWYMAGPIGEVAPWIEDTLAREGWTWRASS